MTAHPSDVLLQLDNYYEILGVSRDATAKDIRKQYRKLALQHHPDKNHHPNAAAAFIKIGNAFECLSDEAERRNYDNQLDGGRRSRYKSASKADPFDFNFGGFDRRQQQQDASTQLAVGRPAAHLSVGNERP